MPARTLTIKVSTSGEVGAQFELLTNRALDNHRQVDTDKLSGHTTGRQLLLIDTYSCEGKFKVDVESIKMSKSESYHRAGPEQQKLSTCMKAETRLTLNFLLVS